MPHLNTFRRKRGDTFNLQELLSIILAIIVVIVGTSVIFDIVDLHAATAQSFETLLSRMDALAQEPLGKTSVQLRVGKGEALLVLPAGINEVSAYYTDKRGPYRYLWFAVSPTAGQQATSVDVDVDEFVIERPSACPPGEPCVCKCPRIEERSGQQTTEQLFPDPDRKIISHPYTCKQPQCKVYSGSTFVFNKEHTEWKYLAPQSIPAFAMVEKSDQGLGTLRIEKYATTYGFCRQQPCITSEMKCEIDYGIHCPAKTELTTEYQKISAACQQATGTQQVSITIPQNYLLNLGSDKPFLVDGQGDAVDIELPISWCGTLPPGGTASGTWQVTVDAARCCLQ